MKKLLYLCVLPLMLLTACGETTTTDETDTPENTPAVDLTGLEIFDMSEQGLFLTMMVPNKDEARGEPVLTYQDGLDNFVLQVGEKFQMVITEDIPDFDLLRGDLEADLTFTNTIVKDEENCLVYVSEAADLEKTFHHFYMTCNIDGIDYVIQDHQMGEFNQMNIDKMIKSVKTLEGKPSA